MGEAKDSQSSTPERGMIFIPALPENTLLPPPVSRAERRSSENYVRATLDLLDRNNDGYLSGDEATGFQNIGGEAGQRIIAALNEIKAQNIAANGIPVFMTSSTIVDNSVLFDSGSITERYANSTNVPGLLPVDVARIVREVLPNGVATVRLSDTMVGITELTATPLPQGRLLIAIAGPTA